MIENERQYDLTGVAAGRFERALAQLGHQASSEEDIHPLLRKAQEDAIRSVLEELRAELREYESRRSGAGATGHSVGQSD